MFKITVAQSSSPHTRGDPDLEEELWGWNCGGRRLCFMHDFRTVSYRRISERPWQLANVETDRERGSLDARPVRRVGRQSIAFVSQIVPGGFAEGRPFIAAGRSHPVSVSAVPHWPLRPAGSVSRCPSYLRPLGSFCPGSPLIPARARGVEGVEGE